MAVASQVKEPSMNITRRDALATGAAAITTGVVTSSLASKAALAGDPVLPAYEAFEAKRREYLAMDDRIDAVRAAVEAEMPSKPHAGRPFKELLIEEIAEQYAWRTPIYERMEVILGGCEDDILEIYYVREQAAYNALMDVEATTLDGLLCQIRAWWARYESPRDTDVAKIDPEDWHDIDPGSVLQRVYHDVARLAGEARS
jgi:hypothetical protein